MQPNCVVAVLGLLVAYLGYVREEGLPKLILRGFLPDKERNLPTLLTFALLVLSSILLALIGARAVVARQAFRFHWLLLAALFSCSPMPDAILAWGDGRVRVSFRAA